MVTRERDPQQVAMEGRRLADITQRSGPWQGGKGVVEAGRPTLTSQRRARIPANYRPTIEVALSQRDLDKIY